MQTPAAEVNSHFTHAIDSPMSISKPLLPSMQTKTAAIAPVSHSSPQKFTEVKQTLAIRQESVKKELDSILGMSPSPQRQIDRNDWNLESPAKFELKLDPVASSKKSKDIRIDLVPAQAE